MMYKIDILHKAHCIFILKLNKNMKKKYGVELTLHRNVRRRTDHASKRWSSTVGAETTCFENKHETH